MVDGSSENDSRESSLSAQSMEELSSISVDEETIEPLESSFHEAFKVMNEIRASKNWCDIKLKVGEKSIECHKLVLASMIPYFHSMFTNDMLEKTSNEIEMKDIDSVTLEKLVNFAYTGSATINSDNVQALILGSSYLQMNYVKDACVKFLNKRLNPSNVIGVRQLAEVSGCSGLFDTCVEYINSNFSEISKTEDFLTINMKELINIIKRNELVVSSEEAVFEAVIRWVQYDQQSRVDLLPLLLDEVRLPLLSARYLVDNVSTIEVIRKSPECRDLVEEAKDYHLVPERQILFQGKRAKPRMKEYIAGIIYAIGGFTIERNRSEVSLSSVEAFSPVISDWCPTKPMSTARYGVAVTTFGGRIYAMGGSNEKGNLNTAEAYDPSNSKWINIAPMNEKKRAMGACVLGNNIYVCGGYNNRALSSVERYSPASDSWEMIAPMNLTRSVGGIASLYGSIWALGGSDNFHIYDSVERYDPRTPRWSNEAPMLTKRCRFGMATMNGKIYVCGGYCGNKLLQTVEEFDPVNNQWRIITSMNTVRSELAVVANMGRLWAIGGSSGYLPSTVLGSVETYNPSTNKWTSAASLEIKRSNHGVAVFPFT